MAGELETRVLLVGWNVRKVPLSAFPVATYLPKVTKEEFAARVRFARRNLQHSKYSQK